MESLKPKLKTLHQSLATSVCSSISTAESVAPCSVSINSVSINSIDMRFCYSMLLLLLQHQQTGCSEACSEWPTIRHFSQLCCFCSFNQPRPSSQQPSPCCCQHIMTCLAQCYWFSCTKKQSTLVCVSAHCAQVHLVFTLAQTFRRPWRSAWAD